MTAPKRSEYTDRLQAVARAAYDRCHPNDCFDDLKRRARFSKEDRCLLADWLAFAQRELGGDEDDRTVASPAGRR
jgi:hypothetical protein